MADILHQAVINAPAKQIYPLFTTKQGMQKWLTPEDSWKITGAEGLEDILTFHYAGGSHSMKIIKLEPNKQVRWECTDGPEEWIGTTVDFFIEDNVKKCTLQFAHNGWAEHTKLFMECDQAWGGFVADIKRLAEG